MNAFKRAFQLFSRQPKENILFPEEPLGRSVSERGGFYGAALHSTLNSRYTLIGKLGWGIHASVWLARDQSMQHQARQHFVAIKILSTHATKLQGRVASELEILQHINNTNMTTHPGRQHIARLQNHFTVTDCHGPHLCLVFEALAPFKGSIFELGRKFPVPVVKRIARQLLHALNFLHQECGIIHTDLKPDNILITLPNAEEAIQRHTTGLLASAKQAVPDSFPPVVLSQPIIPDNLLNANDLSSSLEIQLTDFGTGAFAAGFHADFIQPYALRAPEVILGNGWHTSADIWNLGCLLFEFLTGNWLFTPRGGPTWRIESFHLALMSVLTGEDFDRAYIREGKHFERYFTPEGDPLINFEFQNICSLEQVVDLYGVLGDSEKPLFIDFLRSMLRLRPSDRASAKELLEHEWVKKG